MIVDSFDYIACYKGLHPNLDKAIDWLNSHTLDALENGTTALRLSTTAAMLTCRST